MRPLPWNDGDCFRAVTFENPEDRRRLDDGVYQLRNWTSEITGTRQRGDTERISGRVTAHGRMSVTLDFRGRGRMPSWAILPHDQMPDREDLDNGTIIWHNTVEDFPMQSRGDDNTLLTFQASEPFNITYTNNAYNHIRGHNLGQWVMDEYQNFDYDRYNRFVQDNALYDVMGAQQEYGAQWMDAPPAVRQSRVPQSQPNEVAKAMLLTLLRENERDAFERDNRIVLLGGETGVPYRVGFGRSYNVEAFGPNYLRKLFSMCAHPEDASLPTYDYMAAQYLALRYNESAFIRTANIYANFQDTYQSLNEGELEIVQRIIPHMKPSVRQIYEGFVQRIVTPPEQAEVGVMGQGQRIFGLRDVPLQFAQPLIPPADMGRLVREQMRRDNEMLVARAFQVPPPVIFGQNGNLNGYIPYQRPQRREQGFDSHYGQMGLSIEHPARTGPTDQLVITDYDVRPVMRTVLNITDLMVQEHNVETWLHYTARHLAHLVPYAEEDLVNCLRSTLQQGQPTMLQRPNPRTTFCYAVGINRRTGERLVVKMERCAARNGQLPNEWQINGNADWTPATFYGVKLFMAGGTIMELSFDREVRDIEANFLLNANVDFDFGGVREMLP